ncbi:MAG: thioredoxin family protein [Aquiluna sp.]|nr:thioredoxin family protein [Aquiluna sp.]
MDSTLLLTLALLGFGLIAGLTYRFFHGRGHKVVGNECINLEKLGLLKNELPVTSFGKTATLVQFSTQYCGQCPGVRRALAKLEYRHGDVLFIEADITERLNLAAHFNITQTPTVLVLNSEGVIKYRVGGVPKPRTIEAELEKLGVK